MAKHINSTTALAILSALIGILILLIAILLKLDQIHGALTNSHR